MKNDDTYSTIDHRVKRQLKIKTVGLFLRK
jgi:hypothetical protein